MNYYVATEDGAHFNVFEETNNIFDALICYYEAINDGDEGIYEGIELGYYNWINKDEDDYEHEPLEIHSFN